MTWIGIFYATLHGTAVHKAQMKPAFNDLENDLSPIQNIAWTDCISKIYPLWTDAR